MEQVMTTSSVSGYLAKSQPLPSLKPAGTPKRKYDTVLELFAKQVVLHGDALAVSAGDCCLTYSQLDKYSNKVARCLNALSVRPDMPVGLSVERSAAFVIGALGILKSGGCYLPLDPNYPIDRIRFMLDDASVPVLITRNPTSEWLQSSSGQIRVVDIDNPGIVDEESPLAACPVTADHLAYIMYTSGSTGQPKGVQITHRSLMNLVLWHHDAFEVTNTDRASQLASPGFDAAVWETWPYLAVGASLHIPDEVTRKDAKALRDWFVTNRISVGFVPTPLAEQMIHLKWSPQSALRLLLTGGDTLHRPPEPGLPFAVINNYGPTEATVVATSGLVSSKQNQDSVPAIGRPIANTDIHILDENMQPVPKGIIGEIYIGGIGVAKGYVNQPELTRERFVTHIFGADQNARLYKTGDLARFLPNGEIAFCGRIDGQIKLRGYRIEADEISNVLDKHSAIQNSAVGVYENSLGEKQLSAYVVLQDTAKVTGRALKQFLRSKLPEYMIPSIFIRIETLPLLPSGKLDRNALPLPTLDNMLREESQPANNEVERQLIDIMTKLLGVKTISINDDFFMLGGHSLMGAQLLNKVRETFGVEITLMKLFENGTIASMAKEIERLTLEAGTNTVGDASWSAPIRT
jgi:amino acid adenylation domain-containing protein